MPEPTNEQEKEKEQEQEVVTLDAGQPPMDEPPIDGGDAQTGPFTCCHKLLETCAEPKPTVARCNPKEKAACDLYGDKAG